MTIARHIIASLLIAALSVSCRGPERTANTLTADRLSKVYAGYLLIIEEFAVSGSNDSTRLASRLDSLFRFHGSDSSAFLETAHALENDPAAWGRLYEEVVKHMEKEHQP